MSNRDRFLCPFCEREAMGPTDHCGGSFLDRDHPSSVRPVLIPAGEDVERICSEARERYR